MKTSSGAQLNSIYGKCADFHAYCLDAPEPFALEVDKWEGNREATQKKLEVLQVPVGLKVHADQLQSCQSHVSTAATATVTLAGARGQNN